MRSEVHLSAIPGRKRQQRKRRFPPPILTRYEELRITPGITAKAIYDALRNEFGASNIPGERSLRDWISQDGPAPDAKPWGIGSLDSPERTAAVIAMVRQVTPGQWWPNEDEAWWCSQIVLSAPDVPAGAIPTLARLYWLRSATGRGTDDLDEFIAFAPWDAERAVHYQAAIDAGGVHPPPVNLQEHINTERLDHHTLALYGAPVSPQVVKSAMGLIRQLHPEMERKESHDDPQG